MCELTPEQIDKIAHKVADKLTSRGVKWAVRIMLSIFGLTVVWALKDIYVYVRDHIHIIWGS